MRTVTIDGREYKTKGLKRKQVKELKKNGIDLVNLDVQNAEDALEAVFELAFTAAENEIIEDMYNADVMKLWLAVLKETFGAPEEEKNS